MAPEKMTKTAGAERREINARRAASDKDRTCPTKPSVRGYFSPLECAATIPLLPAPRYVRFGSILRPYGCVGAHNRFPPNCGPIKDDASTALACHKRRHPACLLAAQL